MGIRSAGECESAVVTKGTAPFFHRLGFYVGIPALFTYLILAALFWRPVAVWFFAFIPQAKNVVIPPWLWDFFGNVLSNLAAAVIVALPIWFFFTHKALSAVAKTYNAFDLSTGTPQPWGTVKLRYELLPTSFFQPQFHCVLEDQSRGLVLIGTATYVQQYLVGHYRERDNAARRRAGAFTLQLDGPGTAFEGVISFIDPVTQAPTHGAVRWEMT